MIKIETDTFVKSLIRTKHECMDMKNIFWTKDNINYSKSYTNMNTLG